MKHLRWLILLLLPSLALGQAGGLGPVGGPAISGTPVATHCAEWLNAVTLEDSGAVCGPGSGGTPGGVSGNIQYNNSGAFGGGNLSGDCTTSALVITCTETNGVAFAPVATSGSASDLAAGTLAAARMPALTGDCTTSAGAVTTTCTKTNGTAFGTFATANTATPPTLGGTLTVAALTTGGAVAFTASPVTISGNISSATGNANGYGLVAGAAPNYIDTSGAGGTVTNAYMYALPAANLETTTTTTYSTVYGFFAPIPTCSTGGGGTPTCTTKYGIGTSGGIMASGNIFSGNGSMQVANTGTFTFSGRGVLGSLAAGNIILGGAVGAGSSTNYTLQGQSTSGSNIVGGSLIIEPGAGTGNSTPSTLTFATPHVGSTGSSAQTLNNQIVLGDNTVALPGIASSSAATTGTVCWTTATGNLTVDTTLACLSSLGAWKKDIEPLDSGLAEVMQLRPVSYELKPEYDPEHLGRQVGLLAEDVEQIDKRLVGYGGDGQLRGVRYMQMAALLTKGEQDLQAEAIVFREQTARLLFRQQLEIYFLMAWCLILSYLHWRKRYD